MVTATSFLVFEINALFCAPRNKFRTMMKKDYKAQWDAMFEPGSEVNAEMFSRFYSVYGSKRNVMNCAVPLARAQQLTNFKMPATWNADKCFYTAGTGKFQEGLENWDYNPHIRSLEHLPYMEMLPEAYANLVRSPWFKYPTPALGVGINARHLRYNYQLWQNLKPKTLRGVHTTLIFSTPQVGEALTPHVRLHRLPSYFAALSRVAGPAQLFPAKYLYPDADLGDFADAPAPIFADILPATGGYAFPTEECHTSPFRKMVYYHNTDKYYGYPFSRLWNSNEDINLQNAEPGVIILPNGQPVQARSSESFVYATLDEQMKEELKLDRDGFEKIRCLARACITHDGLPYQLPVEMQCMIYGIVLTAWELEMDKPGDLTSYTLKTQHAAIRGFNFYQKIDPYYTNFMRMVAELGKDPNFKTYPLATHLTHNWLGGNLLISNQASFSEAKLNPNIMRNYYLQQLDWMAGVANLWNHVEFRKRVNLEQQLSQDGLLFHQMRRQLHFDSHLYQRTLLRNPSYWPEMHPGWYELDQQRWSKLESNLPSV